MPLDHETPVQAAERLGRRRARMLPVLAVFFILQQMSFFSQPPAERAVDHVRIGAWVVLSAVILLALNSKGFWFRPKAVRDLIDDEVTRANRGTAMHWGFLAAMIAGIVIYVIQGATQLTTREAIHLIVSAGIVVALARFGILERRAHG
jgi:hypothetical protein